MGRYRLKHSFTAGELSPLMNDRIDFDRFKNGCRKLYNAVCITQGAATRRPGTKFIYDLTTLGLDITNPLVREVPFIFNDIQAYALVFFMHTDGFVRMVLGANDGLVAGTGATCTYPTTSYVTYAGLGDYEALYDASGTVTSIEVTHISESGTSTVLTITTDYTVVYLNGIATISVISGPTSTDGELEVVMEVSTPAIAIGDIVELTFPSGWDIDAFDWAQSGDEIYVTQTGLRPHIIRRNSNTCWSVLAKTFISEPSDWSDEAGWPERVSFHQQRLVFAANNLRRQTVWMTQAGNFDSLAISSPIVDSDAVTFTLDSGTQNKIQWIISSKSLNIGTLGNEWTVKGGTQTALTPSNILAQRQTNNGSEATRPLLVGLTTLFVERHGRTVNEFVYDYTYDSYKTSDMVILSPHLTEKYSITDWTYQQTPDSIIWCIREDGNLLGITYQRQHKVVGWHHHDTDGEFKAITSIPGSTREDDVWLVAMREIDGNPKYYLEKLEDWFIGDTAEEGRFLDSHSTYSGTPITTVTGLDHLEGKTVHILADGTVHPPQEVTGGEITLDNPYSELVIGLQFISEIRPTLPDVPDNKGVSLGRVQRTTQVMIDFYKSLGCWIGRDDSEDGEYEEELPFRVPSDLTGQAVPLYTGWYKLDFPEGFDRDSGYFIRQKDPLPLTVRSVVDYGEVND